MTDTPRLTDAEINGVLFTLDVNRDVVTTRAIRQLLQDVAYHKAIVEKLRAERDEARSARREKLIADTTGALCMTICAPPSKPRSRT